MECKRCGDEIDLRWGNKSYCGQCLHDQLAVSPTQYMGMNSGLDEDIDDMDDAMRAYVPREYRTPFQEEY